MTFGEYIRGKGYTAQSLAQCAGISRRSLENYTTGRRAIKNMTLGLAVKIATALDIRVDELLNFDE